MVDKGVGGAEVAQMPSFDHEKLDVYRLAVDFAQWVGELLDGPLKECKADLVKHLDESSRSTVRNIAEGNGRRSRADRCRFFDISRGSALECAADLDLLVARKHLDVRVAQQGKAMLVRVVSMQIKLIERLVGAQTFT